MSASWARIRFAVLAEDTLLVELRESPGTASLQLVRQLVATLQTDPLPGIREIVPAFTTIAVVFDPLEVVRALPSGRSATAAVARWVRKRSCRLEAAAPAPARRWEVPVTYGGADGPDLPWLARHAGCSEEEVMARHTAAEYEVAAVGFSPGFPYLLGLDPRLYAPRRETPRLRVPAGSIGIGGAQTGIYSLDTPGGWRLIGRTPWRLFDPTRRPPARFAAGDRVRFLAWPADAGAAPPDEPW